jgi:hypothetical protein
MKGMKNMKGFANDVVKCPKLKHYLIIIFIILGVPKELWIVAKDYNYDHINDKRMFLGI